MKTERIQLEIDGDIACITMDDGKANALSYGMLEDLTTALASAEEAKATVLTGRPGCFCAGFDLKVMSQGPEAARDLLVKGAELLLRAYGFPRPLVIACGGHAIAGGALLAATGDTRIGALGAFKVGLNEVQNGLPVPILAHALASDRLDPRALVAAVLHAEIYDPEGAAQVGWLDRVVSADDLDRAAMAEAQRLAALPEVPYRLTKRSLRERTIDYIRENTQRNLEELLGN